MLKYLFTSLNAFADAVVPPATGAVSSATAAVAADPAVAAAATQAPPTWMQFVPFLIILGVMYFVVIRPQAKRQKETQTFLGGLKVGDQIVTQSGILGRITELTEAIATLEVANQVKIRVLRSQILMSQSALQPAKKEGN